MKKKALLTLLITFAAAAAHAQTDSSTLVKTGQKAPSFKCRTIDGHDIEIDKLKGKVIMINFFATWCGPCNQELPVLEKNVWEKYKSNRNFELVIIGRQHTETEVRDFVTRKKFTMPFAPDPAREIFNLYATQLIPRNIIIGKDGKVIFQSIGYTPEEFKEIEKVLAENLK